MRIAIRRLLLACLGAATPLNPSFAGALPDIDALETGESSPKDAAVVVGIEDCARWWDFDRLPAGIQGPGRSRRRTEPDAQFGGDGMPVGGPVELQLTSAHCPQ